MSCQIYPSFWNVDDWSGNRRTLHRQFLQGSYERKIHAVVLASQGVCVEEVGDIGKLYIAVGILSRKVCQDYEYVKMVFQGT